MKSPDEWVESFTKQPVGKYIDKLTSVIFCVMATVIFLSFLICENIILIHRLFAVYFQQLCL